MKSAPKFPYKPCFDLNKKFSENFVQYSLTYSNVGWNIMELTQFTPTHWGLSNGTKIMASGAIVWEISM
jgi:hypothetical protein